MPRDSQIVRQWRIWRLLSESSVPLSAEEITSELQPESVSARTVRRDLEVLRQIGVRVESIPEGRTPRYAILDDGPPLRLNGDALLALKLSLGLLQPFEGTSVGECLSQLARQLEKTIPARTLDHFHALVDDLLVKQPLAPSYRDSGATLTALHEALSAGKTVVLLYRGLNDDVPGARQVHPQALVYGPRGLYLLAVDPERGPDVRSFRVDRIEEARAGSRPSERLPAFDAEDYLAGSIGVFSPEHEPRTYRIRLHSTRAARMLEENPWHSSQIIEEKDGDRWVVTLDLTSSRELLPRVLAMGPDAEVLEPAGFRKEIRGRLQRQVERYRRPLGETKL